MYTTKEFQNYSSFSHFHLQSVLPYHTMNPISKNISNIITTYYHIKIPNIINNSHKTILLPTAPKLTARYYHNFYKAAHYIQISTTPSMIPRLYFTSLVHFILYFKILYELLNVNETSSLRHC
jgi:hypothetical protein